MKPRKWTKEYTESLVKQARSISNVIELSGGKVSGGMHRMVSNYIKRYELDTSHFTGQLWSKGMTISDDMRLLRKQDIDVFVLNGNGTQHSVRRRFRQTSVEYKCVICKSDPVWNGQPLTLHMDHLNGNSADNRLENLRWLCPNCHTQTTTYSNNHR